MLRVPHDVLKQRRHERHGYHTAGKKFPCPPSRITVYNQTLTVSSPSPFSLLSPTHLLPHTQTSPTHFKPGVQSDPEGALWRDPPGYWDDIVYPAYVDAFKDVFVSGDVEHGTPTDKVGRLVLLESLQMSMGEAVERCCEEVKRAVEGLD